MIRQLLAYPFPFPSIRELSVEALRRHALSKAEAQ